MQDVRTVETRVQLAVRAKAKLLFARHLEALLRTFAAHSSTRWGDGDFGTTYLADMDEQRRGVPVSIDWRMSKESTIKKARISVVTSGPSPSLPQARIPTRDVQRDLLRRLIAITKKAEELANNGTTWKFDVAFRLDGLVILCPASPIEFDGNYVVTLPRENDAEKKGWGLNPGLGFLFSVQATDEVDAVGASREGLFERVLFWTFLSNTFCHDTVSLFSVRSNWENSKGRLRALRLRPKQARAFQVYCGPTLKSQLSKLRRTWASLQGKPRKDKVRFLSALAAYRTGLEVARRIDPIRSLAVVAYFAALDALTPQPLHCFGGLTCEICGRLDAGHNLESQKEVLVREVVATLPTKKRRLVGQFLERAYANYRSAYVHSARSPFREYEGAWSVMDIHNEEAFWRDPSPTGLLSGLQDIVRYTLQRELGVGHATAPWLPAPGGGKEKRVTL